MYNYIDTTIKIQVFNFIVTIKENNKINIL